MLRQGHKGCQQRRICRNHRRNGNTYNETMLMEIIEALPLAICVFDRERNVLLANKKTLQFTGKKADQLISIICGMAFGYIHHDDVPEGCGFGKNCMQCKLRTTVYDALETNLPQTIVETTMVFKGLGERKLPCNVFLISTYPIWTDLNFAERSNTIRPWPSFMPLQGMLLSSTWPNAWSQVLKTTLKSPSILQPWSKELKMPLIK